MYMGRFCKIWLEKGFTCVLKCALAAAECSHPEVTCAIDRTLKSSYWLTSVGAFTGKGNEDKRGQPITEAVTDKAWLYLNGHPVVCTRQMEVAAMVSSINPAISSTIDSVEMGSLQQVWLNALYHGCNQVCVVLASVTTVTLHLLSAAG